MIGPKSARWGLVQQTQVSGQHTRSTRYSCSDSSRQQQWGGVPGAPPPPPPPPPPPIHGPRAGRGRWLWVESAPPTHPLPRARQWVIKPRIAFIKMSLALRVHLASRDSGTGQILRRNENNSGLLRPRG